MTGVPWWRRRVFVPIDPDVFPFCHRTDGLPLPPIVAHTAPTMAPNPAPGPGSTEDYTEVGCTADDPSARVRNSHGGEEIWSRGEMMSEAERDKTRSTRARHRGVTAVRRSVSVASDRTQWWRTDGFFGGLKLALAVLECWRGGRS